MPQDVPMDDEDALEAPPTRLPLAIIAILAMVALGGITDLILDEPESWLSVHVAFEASLVVFSLISIAVLSVQWRRTSTELAGTRVKLAATERSLEARRSERDAWRRSAEEALAGLGVAIDRQFTAWGLTPTEREVALLLLKGYGHKQAAGATGRSERTVRQHAVSVYQKAGLGGRAELAAFFLQDLMLPEERTPAS
jgi:DNA-binding NarL/FixJ family response regulator